MFQARQLPMDSLPELCLFTETAPTPAEVPIQGRAGDMALLA